MGLFQRIFFAVLVAGLISGAAMAALQQWRVTPLILAAEVYENAAPEAPAHAHDAGAPAHDHGGDEWAPQDGLERTAYTVAADIFVALGFAFVVAAASVLTGLPVTAANGVLWGIAGFAVFQLAPAFGLPPELPGMPAVEVVPRQIWWWGTVLATATAIYGVARFRNIAAVLVAVALVLAPHVIGAPQIEGAHAGGVPAHLAAAFASATLFSGAAFWLILGPLYGYLVERFSRATAGAAVTA
ncbi:MAG: CbtA family protein [Devosia sp.]